MRIAKIVLIALTCAVALFTSFLTIMMGLSRFVNPFGTPGDLYLGIVVGAVGLIGGVVVLLWADLGAGILFVAAALTVVVIPPDNSLHRAVHRRWFVGILLVQAR